MLWLPLQSIYSCSFSMFEYLKHGTRRLRVKITPEKEQRCQNPNCHYSIVTHIRKFYTLLRSSHTQKQPTHHCAQKTNIQTSKQANKLTHQHNVSLAVARGSICKLAVEREGKRGLKREAQCRRCYNVGTAI